MAAELHITPSRATSSNGLNLDGAKWFFYQSGTTTPQSVYTTSALNVAHSNPVKADAAGKFPNIFFDASLSYRGVLKTADEATTIYDIDPVNAGVLSALAASTGASLIGHKPSGTGSLATTLPVIFNRLHVWTEDYGTFQQAFDAAIARGAELHFRPGQTYSWTSAVSISGKVVVKATGATINFPNAITGLTLNAGADGTEIIGGNWVYTGTTTSGYNAGSNAILVTGTRNGAAVAPTFIENVYVRDATFNGFGNNALEFRYARNCGDENVRVLNGGYSGVFLYLSIS